MNLSEVRYVFWDGSINVEDSKIDPNIKCKQYYLMPDPTVAAPVIPPNAEVTHRFAEGLMRPGITSAVAAKEQRTILSNLVVPAIKVRIMALDTWIVPVTDLLAIKLRLRFVDRIRSMLLIVRSCSGSDDSDASKTATSPDSKVGSSEESKDALPEVAGPAPAADKNENPQTKKGPSKVIYRELFKGDEIRRLPKGTDKDELNQNLSWGESTDTKKGRIAKSEKVEVARCLTHCTVEVWISSDEKAFDDWGGQDDPRTDAEYAPENPMFPVHDQTLPPKDPTELWKSLPESQWKPEWINSARTAWKGRIDHKKQKHADKAGKNQTLIGCSLIEEIMADRTNIHVIDKEPGDRLWSDKSQGNRVVGDGLAFPEFKALIRRTLYEICRYSPLGMALLETVAKKGDNQISLFPAKHFYPHIGGAGINKDVGLPDDYAYMKRVKQLLDFFKTKPAAEIASSTDQDVVDLRADPMISRYLASASQQAGASASTPASVPPPATSSAPSTVPGGIAQPTASGGGPPGSPPGAPPGARPGAPPGAPPGGPGKLPLTKLGTGAAKPVVVLRPSDFALTFAIKRYLLKKIGAAEPGKGCDSHFYFNTNYIAENFRKREYSCRYHKDAGTKTIKFGANAGDSRNLVIASMGYEKINLPIPDDHPEGEDPPFEPKPYHIETPLFLAFLHEMVHARRFQTGYSGEYDEFPTSAPEMKTDPTTYHEHSMVAGMHPKKAEASDDLRNFLDRYKSFNREEFDTIEGAGTTIELTPKQTREAEKVAGLVLDKSGGSTKVAITENALRLELKLPMRRRYVDDNTSNAFEMTGADIAKATKRIYIKPGNLETNSEMKPQTPFVLEEYLEIAKSKTNELFASLGAGSKQVPLMIRDKSYFLKEPAHFILAYQFATVIKSASSDESTKWCPDFVRDTETHEVQSLLATFGIREKIVFIQMSSEPVRTKALRIMQKLNELAEPQLIQICKTSRQLELVHEKASSYDAFAGFVFDLAGKDFDNSWGGTVDPSTVLQPALAAYLPSGYKQKDPHNTLHTLIHEPMHLLSFWCSGFDLWDFGSGSKTVQTYDVVVKGFNDDPLKLQDIITSQFNPQLYKSSESDVPDWLETEVAPRVLVIPNRSKVSEFGNTGLMQTQINKYMQEKADPTSPKAVDAMTQIRKLCAACPEAFAFKDVDEKLGNDLVTMLRDTGGGKAVELRPVKNRSEFAYECLLELSNPDLIKSVINEGTTELFARIVSYRLNIDRKIQAVKISTFAGFYSYEYPHHLVCQLIRDLNTSGDNGLKTVADAYFFGRWKEFNDKLLKLKAGDFNGRYTGTYWNAVARLGISNDKARDEQSCSDSIKELRDKFGIAFFLVGDLTEYILSGTYHDPLCCRHVYKASNDTYDFEKDPIAVGSLGPCCAKLTSPSLAPKDPEPLPFKCPNCEEKIEIPGKAVLKQ